ncbi:MAG: T9SS type A sorting domain-containing protein [Saprospiraceae bacterium]|nr:T9SS type A sorting domain-containing protein [Saprospiraceae bacterium]
MKYLATILLLLSAGARISAQCLDYNGCSAIPTDVCDASTNHAQFWNEMYWWDNAVQTHDLGEGNTDMSITLVDTCSGIFRVSFLLFLDLDGDQIMETVLNSDSLGNAGLGWNSVPYNNLFNPNYSGGTPRAFDERPVPPTDKYGFALETVTSGDTTTARLRWNTFADPNTFVEPQLPYGRHKIRWWAMDTLGYSVQCEQVFEVKDCKKPTVVCLNGLNVNIMPTGMITLWASDFFQYAEDNHTPSSQIQYGIRTAGTGTGFPIDLNGNPINSVTYTCAEIGTQTVELWAKDLAGNADSCTTYVIVQDNFGNCGPGMAITTCISNWCNNGPLLGTAIQIDGTVNFAPPFSYFTQMDSVDANGCLFGPSLNIPIASTFTIAPEKDDFPANGVTVLDLIKISRFMLGLEPGLSPYAMVAADANKSGSITGFDLIELRNLILGIYADLPNNTAWRFIDADFNFPNPQNPFQTAFPEVVSIEDALLNSYQASFKAIKIGDLDCDAAPGLQAPSQNRGLPKRSLTLPDATLLPGESAEITLQMSELGEWAGLQMGLQFDPEKVEVLEVLTGDLPGLDLDAFNRAKPGLLNFVWFKDQSQRIVPGQDLLFLRIRALESLKVSEVFKTSQNFENLGSLGHEPQTLTLDFRQNDAPVSLQETIILNPQPNPTTAGATIPIRLAQAGQVNVEVADLSGKVLWINVLDLSAGSHLLEIPPNAITQAGMYVWRVVEESKSASGRLVKI